MIKTIKDLRYYLECDKIALKIPKNRIPSFLFDNIWRFERNLRYIEYISNNMNNIFYKILYIILKIKFDHLKQKLGFSIGINTFGPGLSIAHYGCIVVNSNARIGANCRIHEGVTIGATNGKRNAAKIGDNCFIGSGAKIIGDISIGNNVCIGANSLVVKDILENSVTVGGNPAKIISSNDSSNNIIKATEIYERIKK